jgi:hypothetical protein
LTREVLSGYQRKAARLMEGYQKTKRRGEVQKEFNSWKGVVSSNIGRQQVCNSAIFSEGGLFRLVRALHSSYHRITDRVEGKGLHRIATLVAECTKMGRNLEQWSKRLGARLEKSLHIGWQV